jgi:hypothetical protein
MNKYYVTLAANHGGPGCVEVTASDYETARQLTFEILGRKWAFIYESLEDVHPLDQTILLKISC